MMIGREDEKWRGGARWTSVERPLWRGEGIGGKVNRLYMRALSFWSIGEIEFVHAVVLLVILLWCGLIL